MTNLHVVQLQTQILSPWTIIQMLSRRHLFPILVAFSVVHAHPHHDELSETDLNAPIDAVLYIHIALQVLVWGILFPTGMILGLTRL